MSEFIIQAFQKSRHEENSREEHQGDGFYKHTGNTDFQIEASYYLRCGTRFAQDPGCGFTLLKC